LELARSESPGGQKHPKNDLSAPILTHRKQSWENEYLEGKMSTKFRNSTWVRKYTGQAFQQAHLGTFWTPTSASKEAPKWHGAYRKKGKFYLRFVKFKFVTSPSGPAHLHFTFLAPMVAFTVFSLQIGFYPSGKGRKTVTQAICHVCNAAPVANGWLSTSIL